MILGATGGRIDHLWANVQSLAIPFKAGVHAEILDSQNRIFLLGEGETHIKKSEAYGPYFSVFRWEMKCLVSRSKERNIRCMIMC